MANKRISITFDSIILTILLFVPTVLSDDTIPIPPVKAQLETWFQQNIGPLDTRKATLDPAIVTAEAAPKVIKVPEEFKTVQEAVNSVPLKNTNRVIISLAPGNYTEKVKIDRDRPFVTLYGDPKYMPAIIFNGDAAKFGTVDSATLIVESDYFNAYNVKIVNSSPRPDGIRPGAQAVAFRIGGEMASFYNCKFYGFQDTVCDDKGKHFFKDCYIEGTVDFIFGDAKSLYVNNELHVIEGDKMAMVTAQARKAEGIDTGYSFVHCTVTGQGSFAHLGRAWMPFAKVVFAYTEMSDVIIPEGWSNDQDPAKSQTAFFAEFSNTGPGSNLAARAPFTKKFTEVEAKPFISLAYIEGSKWLLPPLTQLPAAGVGAAAVGASAAGAGAAGAGAAGVGAAGADAAGAGAAGVGAAGAGAAGTGAAGAGAGAGAAGASAAGAGAASAAGVSAAGAGAGASAAGAGAASAAGVSAAGAGAGAAGAGAGAAGADAANAAGVSAAGAGAGAAGAGAASAAGAGAASAAGAGAQPAVAGAAAGVQPAAGGTAGVQSAR